MYFVDGGYPFADHTGFVCLPEYVEVAIPAFAAFIREQLQWDRLRLVNVFDPRLDLFVKHLSSQRLSIQESKGPLCPYIPLPDNWDQYFNKFLGSSTRKGLRNDLNKIRRLEGFHVTEIQTGNAESHIETLLSLWQARWALKSGDNYAGIRLEDVLNIKRSFLRHCFEDNRLWLNILWDGETPIAGGAVFLDTDKKLLYSKNCGELSVCSVFSGQHMVLVCDSVCNREGIRNLRFRKRRREV